MTKGINVFYNVLDRIQRHVDKHGHTPDAIILNSKEILQLKKHTRIMNYACINDDGLMTIDGVLIKEDDHDP